ncbi:MAG: hypothetical protein WA211_15525 [Candidatus Acidiferrales bacterium]
MEKYILIGSYWLGVVCALIALGMRAAGVMGYELTHSVPGSGRIDYHSMLDGALLFLFVAIASAGYLIAKSQQHKP